MRKENVVAYRTLFKSGSPVIIKSVLKKIDKDTHGS